MKLKQKIIALVLLVGILPALIIGLVSIQNSRAELERQVLGELQALRTIKAKQITQHFIDAQNDIETLADHLSLLLEKQGIESAIIDTDADGQSLFSRYIKRNGYDDLLLFDIEGYCFYSVTQEADYLTNLLTGIYKDSGLGEVVQKTIADSQYHMSDLAPYAPSNSNPAAFIATPVKVQGEVIIVLALQVSPASIDHIMADRTGMGDTGETYLVGADLLMRSDSFLDPVHHSVKASFANPLIGKVDTKAVRQSLLGKTGSQIIRDYNGNLVLSAYAPLPLQDDVVWNIVAEKDVAEAFAPIAKLQTAMLIMAGLGIFLITLLALMFAAILAKPMLILADVIGKVEQTGDLSIRYKNLSNDETGQAGRALNSLLERQQRAIMQINTVMSAVAVGDFGHRVDMPLTGNFSTLKDATNNSVQGVSVVMNSLNQVMIGLASGNFSARMQGGIEGEFSKQVDDAMAAMELALGEIGQVIEALTQGRFDRRIKVDLHGDLNHLKHNINHSMDTLQQTVQEITQVASGISEGDLTQTMSHDYAGEFNNIALALNDTSISVAAIVGDVRAMAQQVGRGAHEIARGGQNLTIRTASQASSLEETAASMGQMASSVRLNADHSQMANRLMQESKEQAQSGGLVVTQAVEAMEKIAQASKKIADIVSLIDGIAFQTNLLALNASIEAARAGEHGCGFAVVAGEVRSLAQRAAEAAKDIKDLIHDSSARVYQGSFLVNQTGESLDNIRNSLDLVATTVGEIARASNEQASGIEQVNYAVSQLDSLNQQNSALVEESASAAGALTQQASALNSLMEFFNIDEKPHPHTESKSKTKSMPEHQDIKRLVSDLNG